MKKLAISIGLIMSAFTVQNHAVTFENQGPGVGGDPVFQTLALGSSQLRTNAAFGPGVGGDPAFGSGVGGDPAFGPGVGGDPLLGPGVGGDPV